MGHESCPARRAIILRGGLQRYRSLAIAKIELPGFKALAVLSVEKVVKRRSLLVVRKRQPFSPVLPHKRLRSALKDDFGFAQVSEASSSVPFGPTPFLNNFDRGFFFGQECCF
jgi:hypothetical protein